MGLGDPTVDQGLDLLELLGCDRPGAVKVKAQAIEINQGAGLSNPGVDNLLESRLQEVGCRVIRLGAPAAGPIHLAVDHIADAHAAALHPAAVDKDAAVPAHGLNRDDQAISAQHAAVADLTTAFSVEGRGVEDQLNTVTSLGPLRRFTIDHQRLNAAAVVQQLIALEAGGLQVGRHLIDGVLQGQIDAHRRGLRPLALGLHGLFKAIQVDREAMLLGDLLGQLQGEAVGVVELKGLLA